MKNYDYWKNFITTGKIDDYLHYIACTQEEGTDDLMTEINLPENSRNNSLLLNSNPIQ